MNSISLSKSIIFQLIGRFVYTAATFFSVLVFSRILTPTDYGFISTYNSFGAILQIFIGLQTYGAFQNAWNNPLVVDRKAYTSSIMSISFISFAVLFSMALVFGSYLENFLGIPKRLFPIFFIQNFAYYIISFYICKFDSEKKVISSALLTALKGVSPIVLSLALVSFFPAKTMIAVIYGTALPIMLIGMYFCIYTYIQGRCFWNSKYNCFCLLFTIPLIFHGLGFLLLSSTDRIMLHKLSNDFVVGIYSVSFTFTSPLNIIYGALNSAWLPFYYDFKNCNDVVAIKMHTRRYIKLFTLIVVCFVLLAEDVFRFFFSDTYLTGMRLIPIFVLVHYIGFLYLFPVNYEFFYGKTKMIAVATLFSGVINVILNIILIPVLGEFGAALGTLGGTFFRFFIHEIFVRFFIPHDYEYANVSILFLPLLLLVGVLCLSSLFCIPQFVRFGVVFIICIYLIYTIKKTHSIF